MIIGCPHCGELFKSLCVNTSVASVEVYDKYLKHFQATHGREFGEFIVACTQVQALAAAYMLMNSATWSDEDAQAETAYTNTGNALSNLLGFEDDSTGDPTTMASKESLGTSSIDD